MGHFYLENAKGFSIVEASSIVSISSVCGIIGTVLSGVISDKFFRGSRNIPALIFGILNTVGISLFLYAPKESIWLFIVAMVIFGISIGVLICFVGGLMAVDLAPKQAAGAALGVVGIASYIGAGLQDIFSGTMIEKGKTTVNNIVYYDFSMVSVFWIASAMLSFILATLIWRAKVHKGLTES